MRVQLNFIKHTDPFPVTVSLLWPGLKLFSHFQCKHIAFTTPLQATNVLFAFASELPSSQRSSLNEACIKCQMTRIWSSVLTEFNSILQKQHVICKFIIQGSSHIKDQSKWHPSESSIGIWVIRLLILLSDHQNNQ